MLASGVLSPAQRANFVPAVAWGFQDAVQGFSEPVGGWPTEESLEGLGPVVAGGLVVEQAAESVVEQVEPVPVEAREPRAAVIV